MAARSRLRRSRNVSLTTHRGGLSTFRGRRWARLRARSTRAGDRALAFGFWTGWWPTITRRRNEMTEVLFYHLQNMSLESVLPPLLEKSLERGWRVVVELTSQ